MSSFGQLDVAAPPPLLQSGSKWAVRSPLESSLALYGLVAAAAILLDAGGPAAAPFKFGACLILPGWSLMRQLAKADPVARLVWTLVSSAALYSVLAVSLVWSQFWYPRPIAAATLVLASAAVVLVPAGYVRRPLPSARRPALSARPTFGGLLPWFMVVVGMVLWVIGLAGTSDGQLGDLGLLPALGPAWYVAVALVSAQCIRGVVARRVASPWLMSVSMTGLVLILYASASLLSSVPRLPWTYKHIAVTDFIAVTGRVDPSVDIYNRWPGFFALSAFTGEAVGLPDAIDYAPWAELGFALIDVVVVLAIARTITRNPRLHWTATLVFTLGNWVNQNYYSPQAISFTLYLTVCLAALTFLRGTRVRWVTFIEERLRKRRHHPDLEEPAAPVGRALRNAAIAGILVLQAVIVVSHQLTPYLAVVGLLPLFVFGYFRPKWLGPALLVIAVAYLLPNLDYVRSNYGLFSGFDVFANASYNPPQAGQLTDAGRWQARAAQVLSGVIGVLAMAGYVRRLVRGEVRTTVMVAWLAVAPVLGLVGQSYGGEGRFRVYLFALPWLAIGVAWLFWSGPVRTRKALLGASASLTATALLFTAVYFQPEADYRVSSDDVAAGRWLDARVEPGDLIFETNFFFPLLIGSNYPLYLESGRVSSLSSFLKSSTNTVTPDEVRKHANTVRSYERAFVIFSDRQQRHAVAHQLFDAAMLPRLEREFAADSSAHIVFNNGAVRIYEIGQMPKPIGVEQR
ncbi:hypothetical protein [Arthrobacter globiformis]|uniref:hypothetical protein n=1 Tax=Arthrobacter globiformis TaxID=1665 RepID=UPI00397B4614